MPNNRNDLLKEALSYLANATGKLTITPETINHALQSQDMVATWPADTKEGWWRYRLKGSTLLGHDPADPLKQPVEAEKIKDFYQKWYTPDAMTLLVVGNVDARSVVDQINKTFGELKGKRETPAPVPDAFSAACGSGEYYDRRGASGPAIYHVGYAVAADS